MNTLHKLVVLNPGLGVISLLVPSILGQRRVSFHVNRVLQIGFPHIWVIVAIVSSLIKRIFWIHFTMMPKVQLGLELHDGGTQTSQFVDTKVLTATNTTMSSTLHWQI